jgi:hypothetical protein
MTEMKRSDMADLIGMLKAAFPNYRPEPETVRVFHHLLADLPKEMLEVAVIACVTEAGRAFAPSVGEIRGKASELRARAERLPSAAEAYLEVMDMPADLERHHTQRHDPDGTWVVEVRQRRFSHPLVGKVARELGWPKIFPGNNPAVDRTQFTRAFEAELKQANDQAGEHPAVTAYLRGNAPQLDGPGQVQYEVLRRVSWKPENNGQTPPG